MGLQQLPLALGQREDRSFDNFVIGSGSQTGGQGRDNREIITTLRSSNLPFIYIWGEQGCGKSHLLQALSREANQQSKSAIYLPLQEVVEMGASILAGLDEMALVVIDDLETIAGQREWEEALFGLYNQIRDSGSRIVVAAKSPPDELSLKLPDLISRFHWGPIFQLQTLGDEEKLIALKQRAHERGFELPDGTVNYLLRHGTRDLQRLFGLLEELDNASLVEQRKLTIPFVKGYLNKNLS
ncbi:MAG: DnaA regulatory inactivator Hda [Gammaproteobacteria bacterium]|nr:DnaA regulatory inactivator Hda [Gammaproteobacteria bacterium]